jgi:hypothetical protein
MAAGTGIIIEFRASEFLTRLYVRNVRMQHLIFTQTQSTTYYMQLERLENCKSRK